MKDDYLLKINNAYGRFMKRAQKSSNILIINTEGLDFVRKRSEKDLILCGKEAIFKKYLKLLKRQVLGSDLQVMSIKLCISFIFNFNI